MSLIKCATLIVQLTELVAGSTIVHAPPWSAGVQLQVPCEPTPKHVSLKRMLVGPRLRPVEVAIAVEQFVRTKPIGPG